MQLGDGGITGNINTPQFTLATTIAALAYKQNDAVSYTGHITKLFSSLLLNDEMHPEGSSPPLQRNDFTGGTEIENGTLYIVDLTSYNQANKGDGAKAGYITFTGRSPARKNTPRSSTPSFRQTPFFTIRFAQTAARVLKTMLT